MMKRLYLLLALIFPLCCLLSLEKPEILTYVSEELPLTGIILQDEKGFVYVDIDDRFIYKLIEFIRADGFEVPPYFGKNGHGAHISIIYTPEAEQYHVPTIDEYGSQVHFEIKECQIVHPLRPDIDAVFLLTVECPQLNTLREKYNLPPPKYDFHIAVGVK